MSSLSLFLEGSFFPFSCQKHAICIIFRTQRVIPFLLPQFLFRLRRSVSVYCSFSLSVKNPSWTSYMLLLYCFRRLLATNCLRLRNAPDPTNNLASARACYWCTTCFRAYVYPQLLTVPFMRMYEILRGNFCLLSSQVIPYEQRQAAESLYRDANSLLYADNKPDEEAIDRVIHKLNIECVTILMTSSI